MKLPVAFENMKEWTLCGPMGPQLPVVLQSHPVLAVDGGAAYSPKIDLWIGDGDSSSAAVNCEHKFEFSSHKAQSDLALALKLLSSVTPIKLHAWGFLGGRKDHDWINAGEFMHFLEGHSLSEVRLYHPNGKVEVRFLGAGEWKFTHQGVFSLASIKNVNVKLTGACDYPIAEDTTLTPLSSFGLSNRASGEIHLLNQGPVMLIFPQDLP